MNHIKTLFIVPTDAHYYKIIKVKKDKGHPQQAVEMAQGGPGKLRPRNN